MSLACAQIGHNEYPSLAPPVVKVLRTRGEIPPDLVEEWRQLCSQSVHDEPFYRPEWIAAYIRAFGPKRELLIVTARVDGRLKALLTLWKDTNLFSGVPVRRLWGTSAPQNWSFDVIAANDEGGRAGTQAIWESLRDLGGWDLLDLSDVPGDGAGATLLEAAKKDGFAVESEVSTNVPYLSLAGWDGTREWWLRHVSRNFRHNVHRALHKFTTPGSLRLHRITSADPAMIQQYYELEMASWRGPAGFAIPLNPEPKQFYEGIMRAAEQFGYLSCYLLELNGQIAAGHLGLTYGGRYFLLKYAYREDLKQVAPGHLLVVSILCDCAERGLSEFVFVGGGGWKESWSKEAREYRRIFVFRPGVVGHAAHAVKYRVRPAVQGWFSR